MFKPSEIGSGFLAPVKSVCNSVKKHTGKVVTSIGAGSASLISSAHASTLLTDTQTALTDAAADAATVGGYVVAGVAGLIVISLILTMIHKLR